MLPVKDDRYSLLYDSATKSSNNINFTLFDYFSNYSILICGAIWTKFLPVTDIPNTARVKLVLYNISQRPIVYKLKCEAKALITAEPNASGTIPAHGVGYCLLIWRRPPDVKNWKDIKVASIMMITEFEGSDDPNINEHTVTKIKCRISSSAVCTSANPPEEHVTFKSASDPSSSLRESSKSKLIIPFIGLPNSSTVPQMPSENVDNDKTNPLSVISAVKDFDGFFMEAKGIVIIAILTAIILLCIQGLLRTKSKIE